MILVDLQRSSEPNAVVSSAELNDAEKAARTRFEEMVRVREEEAKKVAMEDEIRRREVEDKKQVLESREKDKEMN